MDTLDHKNLITAQLEVMSALVELFLTCITEHASRPELTFLEQMLKLCQASGNFRLDLVLESQLEITCGWHDIFSVELPKIIVSIFHLPLSFSLTGMVLAAIRTFPTKTMRGGT